MRKRLAWLSFAVSSLVVISFLIPLGMLVRNQAENRALTGAERDAQSIAAALAVAGSTEMETTVSTDLARAVLEAFGTPEGVSVVFPDGVVVGEPVPDSDNLDEARSGAAFTARVSQGAEVLVPVLVADSPATEDTVVVRNLVPTEDLTQGVAAAWSLLLALGVFLVLVALFAADRLGRSIVKPVTELSVAARELGEGDLQARVEPAGPEEIAEVGEAFNFLAGRLGALLEAERESVADLSHRLRTPLTALRLQAETLEDREEVKSLLEDVDRLEEAVDGMIAEARRPSTDEGLARSAADLGAVVRHRTSFWQVLADEQGRPTSVLVEPGSHAISMTADELGATVDVLIENVFAHTPSGTGYIVRVGSTADGRHRLTVTDAGPGFNDVSLVRRGESSSGSTGLGLDIVARAAERSGGSMRVGNAGGGGAEVSVVFGAAVEGQDEATPAGSSVEATSARASSTSL